MVSRDKYSNNHMIEVANGDGILQIKGTLQLEQDSGSISHPIRFKDADGWVIIQNGNLLLLAKSDNSTSASLQINTGSAGSFVSSGRSNLVDGFITGAATGSEYIKTHAVKTSVTVSASSTSSKVTFPSQLEDVFIFGVSCLLQDDSNNWWSVGAGPDPGYAVRVEPTGANRGFHIIFENFGSDLFGTGSHSLNYIVFYSE